MHTTAVCASVDASRYSRQQRGGNNKRDGCFCSPWPTLLLHHQEQSGKEMEPIVRDDTHTKGSRWGVFTSCCWTGITHNCLYCYNINCFLGECVCVCVCVCVCALTVCPVYEWECVMMRGLFFLFMAQQMVWWCASHLVCVLRRRQSEWENFWSVVQIWDGKGKDMQDLPRWPNQMLICVHLAGVCVTL